MGQGYPERDPSHQGVYPMFHHRIKVMSQKKLVLICSNPSKIPHSISDPLFFPLICPWGVAYATPMKVLSNQITFYCIACV